MAALTWRFIPPQNFSISTANPINDTLAAWNTLFTQGSPSPANSFWEIAQYVSSTPRSLLLRRRSGAAGRILFFGNDGTSPNADSIQTGLSGPGNYLAYSQTSNSNTVDANWNSAAPLSATDYIPAVAYGINTGTTETWVMWGAECEAGVVVAAFRKTAAITPTIGVYHAFAGDLFIGLDETIYPCICGATSVNTFSAASLDYISAASATSGAISGAVVIRAFGYDFPVSRAHLTQSAATTQSQQAFWDYSSNTLHFAPIIMYAGNTGFNGDLSLVGKIRQIAYGPTALAVTHVSSPDTGEVCATAICPHIAGAAVSTVSWQDAMWVVNCEV